MTDTPEKLDYSKTLYLPETEFPMRAGLPAKEPEMAKKWKDMELYKKLRWSSLRQRQYPYRPCAEQGVEGRHHPLVPDARL
jgi:isoleucyl-tRNA synthetase